MTGNGMCEETVGRVVDRLRAALPEGWRVELAPLEAAGGLDGVVRISSSSARGADFAAQFQCAPAPRSWPPALWRTLKALRASVEADGHAGLLVLASYLSAPVRAELGRAGISYADATGWVRLVSDRPMLAVTAAGADRAPGLDARRRTLSLKGAGAGRIVRALLSRTPPVGVRELAEAAGVRPGSVSKTLPLLVSEEAVRREAGKVVAVDRRSVLSRWTLDYQVLASNGKPAWFVAPRGLGAAVAAVASAPRVAVTGGQAGVSWLPEGTAPIVPVTQLVVYAADVDATAAALGLVAVDAPSANVILLTPQDSAILDDPTRKDGVPVAPLPLVLADLLTLPGRYPLQAEALMDALAKTDTDWRP